MRGLVFLCWFCTVCFVRVATVCVVAGVFIKFNMWVAWVVRGLVGVL